MTDETSRVILFVFAGRKPNMELQIPFAKKILEENPNVDYHVWNLSREQIDNKYLQTIIGERITVFNEYQKFTPGYDEVYKHYADTKFKKNIFVKLDDDIVFVQTKKFKQFVEEIYSNPDTVVSANVINNGACTPLEKGIWEKFSNLGIPLLDVHKSAKYAHEAHNYFFQNYTKMLQQKIKTIPTNDWLSINTIGYNWEMGKKISEIVGTRYDKKTIVAGRQLLDLGDEGVVNTLPRAIVQGFLVAHLTFGPQKLTDSQLKQWRKLYSAISSHYLENDQDAISEIEKILSQKTHLNSANEWRSRWSGKEKDPTEGFYTP